MSDTLERELAHIVHQHPVHRPVQVRQVVARGLVDGDAERMNTRINKKYGTKFKMPVVYYSQLMTVAYGGSAREAGLDGNIIRATKLEAIAGK